MSFRWIAISFLIVMIIPLGIPAAIKAQGNDPCGVVDAFDYPIDGVSPLSDDFGMYRQWFVGRHTGIDIAFDRYGDPVRAAAKGRVTYADPKGWNDERGVVIIEHTFPDGSVFFTLYGHMEQINDHTFPKVGTCVNRGQIVGSVGHPMHSAPHLHFEVRQMGQNDGGPGYWASDPLDGGWLHPIDFTEGWRLRLSPAYKSIISAGGGPIVPPIWHADGTVTFAEEYHLEGRNASPHPQISLTAQSNYLWRLDVQGLTGIVEMPDGRVLGSTVDNQILVVNRKQARFDTSWKADRPLHSPPLRLGNSLVFLSEDNRAISYEIDGKLRWQTNPLGTHIEHFTQSGDRLAISLGTDNGFRVVVIDSAGKVIFQADAPNPIIPIADKDKGIQNGGFFLLTGTQVIRLSSTMSASALIDVGQVLDRASQIAIDPQGNVVLYPGRGQRIYSYNPAGKLRWQVSLTTPQADPPLVGIGAGCAAYVLTSDGALLAYRATDGALRGITSLYAGGIHGHPASRFLQVSPDDQVQFSAGYLSIATVDGNILADGCKKT